METSADLVQDAFAQNGDTDNSILPATPIQFLSADETEYFVVVEENAQDPGGDTDHLLPAQVQGASRSVWHTHEDEEKQITIKGEENKQDLLGRSGDLQKQTATADKVQQFEDQRELKAEQSVLEHEGVVDKLRKQRRPIEQAIPNKVQLIAVNDSRDRIRVAATNNQVQLNAAVHLENPIHSTICASLPTPEPTETRQNTKGQLELKTEQSFFEHQEQDDDLHTQTAAATNKVQLFTAGPSRNPVRVSVVNNKVQLIGAGPLQNPIRVSNAKNRIQLIAAGLSVNPIRTAVARLPTPEPTRLGLLQDNEDQKQLKIEQTLFEHQRKDDDLHTQTAAVNNKFMVIAAGPSPHPIRVSAAKNRTQLIAAGSSVNPIRTVDLRLPAPESTRLGLLQDNEDQQDKETEQTFVEHQRDAEDLHTQAAAGPSQSPIRASAANNGIDLIAGNSIRLVRTRLATPESTGLGLLKDNENQQDLETEQTFVEHQRDADNLHTQTAAEPSQHPFRASAANNRIQLIEVGASGNSIRTVGARLPTPEPLRLGLLQGNEDQKQLKIEQTLFEDQRDANDLHTQTAAKSSQHPIRASASNNRIQLIEVGTSSNSIRMVGARLPTPEPTRLGLSQYNEDQKQLKIEQTLFEHQRDDDDLHTYTAAANNKLQLITAEPSQHPIRVSAANNRFQLIAAGPSVNPNRTVGARIRTPEPTRLGLLQHNEDQQQIKIEQTLFEHQRDDDDLHTQAAAGPSQNSIRASAAINGIDLYPGNSIRLVRTRLPTPEPTGLGLLQDNEDQQDLKTEQTLLEHQRDDDDLHTQTAAGPSQNPDRVSTANNVIQLIAAGPSRDSARVSLPTDGQSLSVVSQHNACNQHPPVFDPNYLKNQLLQTLEGQQILIKAKQGELIEAKQNKLAKVVAEYHVAYKSRLTTADLELYTLALTTLFPNEQKETYFVPRGGSRKNHGGKIANKIGNYKQATKHEEEKENAHANGLGGNGESDSEDINEETKWLLVNRIPWTTVLDRWPASFVYRNKYLRNAKQIPKLLQDYVHYKDPCGYQLVDLDFASLFPDARSGIDRLNWICTELRPYIAKKAVDPSKVRLLQLLESEDNNTKVYGLILILSTILPPISAGRKYKPTILVAQDDCVLIAANDVEVREKVESLYVAYAEQGFPVVPKLVFLGSGPENFTGSFYVCYKDIQYEFESAARALDVLIKVTAVFGLPYSKLSRLVWQFISDTIYGLVQKESYSAIIKVNRYLQTRSE